MTWWRRRQPSSPLSGPVAEYLVQAHALLQEYGRTLELLENLVCPETVLPASKDTLKTAIKTLLNSETDENFRNALMTGYSELCRFVPPESPILSERALRFHEYIRKGVLPNVRPEDSEWDDYSRYLELVGQINRESMILLEEIMRFVGKDPHAPLSPEGRQWLAALLSKQGLGLDELEATFERWDRSR